MTDEPERRAAADDIEPQARLRLVRARAPARRGDVEAADELLREAAEIVDPTDYAILHLELAFARAGIDRVAGPRDAERQALERASEVADAKGNVVAAERKTAVGGGLTVGQARRLGGQSPTRLQNVAPAFLKRVCSSDFSSSCSRRPT